MRKWFFGMFRLVYGRIQCVVIHSFYLPIRVFVCLLVLFAGHIAVFNGKHRVALENKILNFHFMFMLKYNYIYVCVCV